MNWWWIIGIPIGVYLGRLFVLWWTNRQRPRQWMLRATLENGKTIFWTALDDGSECWELTNPLVGQRIISVEIRVDTGKPWTWPRASTPEEWSAEGPP